MMTLPNIAFSGYMGSGKTTLANLLVHHYGYQKRAFADPLKSIYEELVGRPINKAADRLHLQALGQFGRSIEPALWVDKMVHWLDTPEAKGQPIVCDDVRFLNEAQALGWYGGFVLVHVEIERGEVVARIKERDGAFDPAWLDDSSEQVHLTLPHDETIPGTGNALDNLHALIRRLTHAQLG